MLNFMQKNEKVQIDKRMNIENSRFLWKSNEFLKQKIRNIK